jgi:hypothetical protein
MPDAFSRSPLLRGQSVRKRNERERQTGRKRAGNEYSRLQLVVESLLQSRHSVGSESKRKGSSNTGCVQSEPTPKRPFSQEKRPTLEEKEQAQERDRQKERQSEQ